MIALPTGLAQAGVAGVAASLWSVSEVSTMMLMARFYDLWRKEGLTPAEALRQAQRWLRDTTNGEKRAYFEGFLPGFGPKKTPADTASTLHKAVVLEDPMARTFADPFYWAAFTYTGA